MVSVAEAVICRRLGGSYSSRIQVVGQAASVDLLTEELTFLVSSFLELVEAERFLDEDKDRDGSTLADTVGTMRDSRRLDTSSSSTQRRVLRFWRESSREVKLRTREGYGELELVELGMCTVMVEKDSMVLAEMLFEGLERFDAIRFLE